MPYTNPAAASPNTTCLKPDATTARRVSSVIPAPIRNSATALTERLAITALDPVRKKNGASGRMAPSANRTNDVTAASHADPPSSCGSIPSSSRASVSSAFSRLAISRRASARACSSGSPFAW
jgi:hypothetical protein